MIKFNSLKSQTDFMKLFKFSLPKIYLVQHIQFLFHYYLTTSIKRNLHNIHSAVAASERTKKYPEGIASRQISMILFF